MIGLTRDEDGKRDAVFVCDQCREPIKDIDMAVVVWDGPIEAALDLMVLPMMVHKGPCDTEQLGRSMEASHFLCRLAVEYWGSWSPPERDRGAVERLSELG